MSKPLRVVLTGVETTGKTASSHELAAHFGGAVLPEYGRAWAETRGTDFTMTALREIAKGHLDARIALEATQHSLIIEDTDIVMTSAWAIMLHGKRDPILSAIPATGDLYLLYRPDIPWIDDGTRMFGGDMRTRFHTIVREELAIRRIVPVIVEGPREQRHATAVAAIDRLLARR